MTTISISDARASLPTILDRVIAGEDVTITRHGRAIAVVVSPDTLRIRRADSALARADVLRSLLDQGRDIHLDDAAGLSESAARELADDVMESRAAR